MADEERVGTFVALGSVLSSAFFLAFYYLSMHIFGYSYNLLVCSALALLLITHAGAFLVGSLTRQGIVLLGLSLVLLLEEVLINSESMLYGLLFAFSMMIVLPILAVFVQGLSRCLEAYGIVFVSRIVFIPIQPAFLTVAFSQPVLYTLIFLSLAFYMRFRGVQPEQAGLTRGRFSPLIQVPAAVALGFLLGFIEYQILVPVPIGTQERLLETIAYLFVVMLVFVATTEEIMFRGLLLNFVSDVVPVAQSILIVSVQFGLMHLGWGVPLEILFAYLAGILFSFAFYKTHSLLMPIIMHGVGNITLYLFALFA